MFYIILVIIVADFILGRSLSLLNASWQNKPIPQEVSDIYTEEKRNNQKDYSRANRRQSWVVNSFNFVVLMLMYCLGGFRLLDTWVHNWTLGIGNMYVQDIVMAILYFGILAVGSMIIGLPFSIYDTFVTEEKFGFNRTTKKTFALDKLKQTGLSLLITSIVLAAVVSIYDSIPDWFWLLAWAVMTTFSLFMSYFYSQLIVPIFNKQTPLEEGELRTAIEAFAEKVGFKIKDIYVMDAGKRSSHANAYFTGFGKRKRIVLYDTLIRQLSTEEIVAVLAHEIGHNKRKHIVKRIVVSMAESLVMFGLMGLVLKHNLCAGAIGCVASFHVNMYLFYLLYQPLDLLLSLAGNAASRKHEYQADAFAAQNGMGDALISALKKMSGHSLSNPTPHPAFVVFHYNHPTLVQRIQAING